MENLNQNLKKTTIKELDANLTVLTKCNKGPVKLLNTISGSNS